MEKENKTRSGFLVNVVLLEDGLPAEIESAIPPETAGRENRIVRASSPEDAKAKLESFPEPYRKYAAVVSRRSGWAGSVIPNNVVEYAGNPAKAASQVEWLFGKKKSQPRVFYWSDPHFGHKNIIRYCGRPWNSGKDEAGNVVVTDDDVRRMDEDIVSKFNAVVGPDDLTWCLGDFAMGDRSRIPELVSRLNGKINLVMGNHDWFRTPKSKYAGVVDFFYKAGFNRVYDKSVIVNGFMILSHEPFPFIGKDTPFYSVYGHVHDSSNYETWTPGGCCVCVERHGYAPVPEEKIIEKAKAMREEQE